MWPLLMLIAVFGLVFVFSVAGQGFANYLSRDLQDEELERFNQRFVRASLIVIALIIAAALLVAHTLQI